MKKSICIAWYAYPSYIQWSDRTRRVERRSYLETLLQTQTLPRNIGEYFLNKGYSVDYLLGSSFLTSNLWLKKGYLFWSKPSNLLQRIIYFVDRKIYQSYIDYIYTAKKYDIISFEGIAPSLSTFSNSNDKTKTFLWMGIYPFSLPQNSVVRQAIPYMDLVVCTGEKIVNEACEIGAKNTLFINGGIDNTLFFPENMDSRLKSKYECDIGFVGSLSRHHQTRIKHLRHVIESCSDLRIKVWSPNVDTCPPDIKSYVALSESAIDMRHAICGAKINLNIQIDGGEKETRGLNFRTFEISACRGFQLMHYQKGIEEIYNLESEVVCYKSIDDLVSLIRFYLSNNNEREIIANNAYLRTIRDHLWYSRIEQIYNVI